jgi:hypothetical protein
MSEFRNRDDDEKPRKGFLASLPRRSVARIFLLLAMLAGILILRHQASAIAGCMNQALMPPPPRATHESRGDASAPGPIRVRVQVPEAATR